MRRSDIEREIRAAGGRMTSQCGAILDVLLETNGHFTADEVYDRAGKAHSDLDRSTVYRTLFRLRKLGVVRETSGADGALQFEMVERGMHHHLICATCGAIAEVEDDALAPVRDHLRERFGFRASLEHYAIRGVCATCAANGKTRG